MNVTEAASFYTSRGRSVVPVPFRGKNPGFDQWQNLRLGEADLPRYFNGHAQNVGILNGEPSGWQVDVDLDHPRAIELAESMLPPTPAIFGRKSKRRSHWQYIVTGPVKTTQIKLRKKQKDGDKARTIIELRSTGTQTVFPPSVHESGEQIEWEVEGAEPAVVDPEELLAAVEAIGAKVLEELGERPRPRSKQAAAPPTAGSVNPQVERCLAEMKRMKLSDHNDGSHRLLSAACRAVEHDLDDTHAIACIRTYAGHQPFPQEWSDEDILKRLRDAEQMCTRGKARKMPSDAPTILLDTDEHRAIREAIQALKADGEVFQRGGVLVRAVQEKGVREGVKRDGAVVIQPLPLANLRDRLTRVAHFTKIKKRDEIPAHPTGWLVNGVDSRGYWPEIPNLLGLTDAPTLRPDGTVLQSRGYDAASQVLYLPGEEFPPVADDVDIDDAQAAVEALLEVVCDFRFETPAHRSAWLASAATPVARYAFTGPSPLFLFDANIRGAGKTLLANCSGRIVLGHELPVSSYTHGGEEMRKSITSIAMSGDRVVLLDNLDTSFGNGALDRALTTTRWKDRLLGGNKQVDLPLLTTWYASGNNVVISGDTIRRVLHVRLDVLEEHPEERGDFRHPNLIRWVTANRPRLLCAILTMLAGYCRAGRPDQHLGAYGSFEGWSDLVRSALVWSGLPDPCDTRVHLARMADLAGDALAQLITAWREYDAQREGLTVAPLLRVLYPSKGDAPMDDASLAMRAAIEAVAGNSSGKAPDTRKLGNRLRTYRRRVIGGLYLDIDGSQRRDGALWRLMEVANAPPAP